MNESNIEVISNGYHDKTFVKLNGEDVSKRITGLEYKVQVGEIPSLQLNMAEGGIKLNIKEKVCKSLTVLAIEEVERRTRAEYIFDNLDHEGITDFLTYVLSEDDSLIVTGWTRESDGYLYIRLGYFEDETIDEFIKEVIPHMPKTIVFINDDDGSTIC